ncbi:2-dehydro-3-deoxygalactonokinase [Brevibacterium marinum]|uniref:2-dehydro-3-deoxygalactonokinase n=1 Tax=Brevibacterium marinum TaxID=418643 RepID=A0A846RYQ9_9MICO|nr:2-dehydro-3-deoxygalactonokinase [Brevibacterium marinum]NJC57076.1 2-dehydro-3-deoxygalactonokinase [Brevibacterium marinum]
MAKQAPPGDPQMIGLDWGTSSLRAFLIGSDGTVLAERNGSDGIMAVSPDAADLRGEFSRIAQTAIGDWLPAHGSLPLLACGMIGSTQGIAEAGYLDLPTDLGAVGGQLMTVELTIGELHIVPGLQKTSTDATAPDVIRGEETELLGLLSAGQTEPTTVVLPGTHTKWVSCEGTRVTDFSTSMSGEVFGLLSTSSILSRLAEPTDDFHLDAFDWGLSVGADDPAALTSSIFSARTWALDGRLHAEAINDYLSGMLIGAEVASQLTTKADSAAPFIVCGTADLTMRYSRALRRHGRETTEADPRAAATGLFRIAEQSGLVPTKETTND